MSPPLVSPLVKVVFGCFHIHSLFALIRISWWVGGQKPRGSLHFVHWSEIMSVKSPLLQPFTKHFERLMICMCFSSCWPVWLSAQISRGQRISSPLQVKAKDRVHLFKQVKVWLFWSAPEFHHCVYTDQNEPHRAKMNQSSIQPN